MKDSSSSRLLRLPAEIRTLIFEFALTSANPIVAFRLDSYQRDSYDQATQPSLTRVSRQVRNESLPVFYECNDFVLHTETPKADEGHKWLRCNSAYLATLKCISFWVRYVPLANVRATSQGAIHVSLSRPRKRNSWTVKESWRWITVLRKPAELTGDAKFMLEKLGEMSSEIGTETAGPDEYWSLMMDLRMFYVQKKTT